MDVLWFSIRWTDPVQTCGNSEKHSDYFASEKRGGVSRKRKEKKIRGRKSDRYKRGIERERERERERRKEDETVREK